MNNQLADDPPHIPGKKETSLLTNRSKVGAQSKKSAYANTQSVD